MPINDWWAGQPAERYWMEITDRDDLGVDLRAPQTNAAGGEEWSYSLVTYSRPGDLVLHWHKSRAGEPALIGWSEVVGPLSTDSMDWLAHGTRGRARGHAETVANWVMQLGGLHELDLPLTRSALEPHRAEILAVLDDLESAQRGAAVYAPFYLYGKRQRNLMQLRAQQAYLTKFPAALVPTVERLSGRQIGGIAHAGTAAPRRPRDGTVGGQGRLQDPVLRRLIEEYAVDRARAYYADAGASKIEPLGKPYDLKVQIGETERHIEVKGTTVDGAVSVVLTVGEVRHAHSWRYTDLFVVDGISATVDGDSYKLAGGSIHVWTNWTPDERALHPTEFSYDLPPRRAGLGRTY